MMIFVGLLRGLRRWRSRPTTFERTQQWTRSMVLEKTKKYYHYLVSQKGRKIVKNAASYSSSSVKAFFWLWRERWGQMHIDDICGPLTNSNSSSLFVRRSQPHSSSNSTYYNNCSTHKSIVLSEARSRSNYPWWRLPSAMICVPPEWPRFFQKRSAFLFSQISEMMSIANLWQFHEQIGSEHCQRSDFFQPFLCKWKAIKSNIKSMITDVNFSVRC